jgi:hypothetical protein
MRTYGLLFCLVASVGYAAPVAEDNSNSNAAKSSSGEAPSLILRTEYGIDWSSANTSVPLPGKVTIDKNLWAVGVAEIVGDIDHTRIKCQAYDKSNKAIGKSFDGYGTAYLGKKSGDTLLVHEVKCDLSKPK